MATVHKADVVWQGDFKNGEGNIKLGSGAFEGKYSYKSRVAEQSPQTNPEELIGGAHAACFSMALSAMLGKANFPPETINTTAKVSLSTEGGNLAISQIDLETRAKVPNISEDEFLKIAENAKNNCPVSKALAAVPINFKASLE